MDLELSRLTGQGTVGGPVRSAESHQVESGMGVEVGSLLSRKWGLSRKRTSLWWCRVLCVAQKLAVSCHGEYRTPEVGIATYTG